MKGIDMPLLFGLSSIRDLDDDDDDDADNDDDDDISPSLFT